MRKNLSICLSVENWNRIANTIDNSNYCIVKNFNGKRVCTYSKSAGNLQGFNANKYLSRKIKKRLNKK